MIRTVWVKLTVGVFLLFSLTGCWDMKTIQDTNYMTAVGFDYQDGKYIVYGQMLSFGSVARQEGGGFASGAPPLIWVGREEGATANEAYNKLYRTSQQRVFWGHIGAYLFTKRALSQGSSKFADGAIRSIETRYTQWVYSTDESIESVFSILPFFNGSPLNSILMQPIDNYRQRSYIIPRRLSNVVSNSREPGMTVMLPSLGIADEVWVKNKKPDPKLVVNGVYAVNQHDQLEWFSDKQLQGVRWLNKYTSRTNLVLYKDGKAVQSVSIKPKSRIKPRLDGEQPIFDMEIKAKASISEINEVIDEVTLEKLIAKQIAEEVEMTFNLGKSRGIDLYGLEHVLYRDDFAAWAKTYR